MRKSKNLLGEFYSQLRRNATELMKFPEIKTLFFKTNYVLLIFFGIISSYVYGMAIVLGGGISGLSAGYYLLKKFGQPTAIFEASNRVGGWIRTEKYIDKGFTFEFGPRTIRPKGIPGANTLEIIDELQIPIVGITSAHAAAKNRMIYANGKLCMLPNSFGGVLKITPPFSQPLLMAAWNDLKGEPKKIKYGDESIYDFVQRRFGTEIADYAISSMICGICAGNSKEISVRFLMNDIFEKEQKYGGVLKGMFMSILDRNKKVMKSAELFTGEKPKLYEEAKRKKWSIYSLENGLETLPHRMSEYLRDNKVEINLSSECRSITFHENCARLNIKNQEIEAIHVISALPSYKLASCIKHHHPGLAGQLMEIPYVDVAVINLQFSNSDLVKQAAFGFLVPPLERRPILGVIFDSCCFDMKDNTVLTVMMGGAWFEEYFGTNPSQKELLDVALKELQTIMGIYEAPKATKVNILRKCIPQYKIGHKQRVDDIRRYIKRYKLPLSLCGAAYDGVGINDVILSARMCVDQLSSN